MCLLLIQEGVGSFSTTVAYSKYKSIVFKKLIVLFQVLIKVLKPKDKFYLLGYSSGTLIALEMAAILENQGNIELQNI